MFGEEMYSIYFLKRREESKMSKPKKIFSLSKMKTQKDSGSGFLKEGKLKYIGM